MLTTIRQPMKSFSESKQKSGQTDTLNALEQFTREAERLREELRAVEMGRQILERYLHERGELPESDNTYTPVHHPVTVSERPIESRYQQPEERSAPRRGYTRKTTGKREIPISYDVNGTYSDKVLYILNKEGEYSTRQIADYIFEHDPKNAGQPEEKRFDLVNLNVGKACTRLLEKGLVEQEKVGNANFYRLA